MTARRKNAALERAVRIELLLARSALEREALCRRCDEVRQSFSGVGRSFSLLGTWRRLLRGGVPQLVSLLGGAGRRYPLLISAASTLLMGRKSRMLKVGGLAVTAWQVYRNWLDKRKKAGDADDSPEKLR